MSVVLSLISNHQLTPVFYICYQSTAPFLHIGALATVTAISWLVAGYVVRRERSSKCWLVKIPVISRADFCIWFIWVIQSDRDWRKSFLWLSWIELRFSACFHDEVPSCNIWGTKWRYCEDVVWCSIGVTTHVHTCLIDFQFFPVITLW